MNIDIEGIVREEIRNLIREQLNITTDSVKVTVKPKRTVNKRTNEPDSGWEFASVKGSGKRRTTEEMALHELEKEKGRLPPSGTKREFRRGLTHVSGPAGKGKSLSGAQLQRGPPRTTLDSRRPWGGPRCAGPPLFRRFQGIVGKAGRNYENPTARFFM